MSIKISEHTAAQLLSLFKLKNIFKKSLHYQTDIDCDSTSEAHCFTSQPLQMVIFAVDSCNFSSFQLETAACFCPNLPETEPFSKRKIQH